MVVFAAVVGRRMEGREERREAKPRHEVVSSLQSTRRRCNLLPLAARFCSLDVLHHNSPLRTTYFDLLGRLLTSGHHAGRRKSKRVWPSSIWQEVKRRYDSEGTGVWYNGEVRGYCVNSDRTAVGLGTFLTP